MTLEELTLIVTAQQSEIARHEQKMAYVRALLGQSNTTFQQSEMTQHEQEMAPIRAILASSKAMLEQSNTAPKGTETGLTRAHALTQQLAQLAASLKDLRNLVDNCIAARKEREEENRNS